MAAPGTGAPYDARMRTHRAVALIAVVALSLGTGLTACASDDSESASTCEAMQQLSASVEGLFSLDLVSEGTNGLQTRVDDIGEAWQDVQDTAEGQFGPELATFQEALNQFGSTLTSAADGDTSISDTIPQLQDDVTALRQAWDGLTSAVDSELSDCDLSTSSS